MAVARQFDTGAWPLVTDENRVFTRVPFAHPVRWIDEKGDGGTAFIRNVSRSGIGVTLGRYLRPGGPGLRFVFDDIEYNGTRIEVSTVAVWCRPESAAHDQFVAGFKIVDDSRATLVAMSEVFYAAIRQFAQTQHIH